jgi:hypothetical protein
VMTILATDPDGVFVQLLEWVQGSQAIP